MTVVIFVVHNNNKNKILYLDNCKIHIVVNNFLEYYVIHVITNAKFSFLG
jgi:hypothetical protein